MRALLASVALSLAVSGCADPERAAQAAREAALADECKAFAKTIKRADSMANAAAFTRDQLTRLDELEDKKLGGCDAAVATALITARVATAHEQMKEIIREANQ